MAEQFEGATEEYGDVLHKIRDDLAESETNDTHLDGSDHDWDLVINWVCVTCRAMRDAKVVQ